MGGRNVGQKLTLHLVALTSCGRDQMGERGLLGGWEILRVGILSCAGTRRLVGLHCIQLCLGGPWGKGMFAPLQPPSPKGSSDLCHQNCRYSSEQDVQTKLGPTSLGVRFGCGLRATSRTAPLPRPARSPACPLPSQKRPPSSQNWPCTSKVQLTTLHPHSQGPCY